MSEKNAPMGAKVGSIPLKVGGLDRLRRTLEELNEHVQAAQDIIDSLGTVELDIVADFPEQHED